jgi:hypothetical protein
LIWNVLPAIVAVPIRDADPLFSAIDKRWLPGPTFVPAVVGAIHVAPDAAVHEQPSATDTPTVMSSGEEGIVIPLLESVALHEAAEVRLGAWVIVNVRPAMVMTPERSVDNGFGATAYCTVPFPVAEPPAVIVIQAESLVAVQVQATDAATVIDPFDPVAATVTDSGDSATAHP